MDRNKRNIIKELGFFWVETSERAQHWVVSYMIFVTSITGMNKKTDDFLLILLTVDSSDSADIA